MYRLPRSEEAISLAARGRVRASGPRMLIKGSRKFTEQERQALADGGRHTHYNEGLLTLECGHHVIRIMPKWTGATSALCRLCGERDRDLPE